MKKILYLKANKKFFIVMMALMPLVVPAQTVPNLYPMECIARIIKNHTGINSFYRDTIPKRITKPAANKKDASKKGKPDSIFINRDREIKERVLKTWKH